MYSAPDSVEPGKKNYLIQSWISFVVLPVITIFQLGAPLHAFQSDMIDKNHAL